MPQNNPLIPLPIPLCNPKLLKAALNVFEAEGQTLEDPRDLAYETTAQKRLLYTSRSGRAGFLYQIGGVNS
jgi:hypothetical protein